MFKKFYLFLTLLTAFLCFGAGNVWGDQLNEGFEGSFAPDGWKVQTTKGTKSWARSYSYKYNGSYSAYANYGPSTGNDTYLITPQLAPADGESLSFWFYAQYTNYQTTIQVEVSTTDNEVASFGTVLETYVSCSTGDNTFSTLWKNFTIDLSAYKGQDIYIAFHVIDANGNNVFLDDVSGVTLKPESCPKPGTPEASDVTSTTATISWTQGGTEDTWNLRYKKSTTSVWTEVNGLTSTTYELTGLEAGKITYNYEVQADCGGGDESKWAAGTAFQTDCGIIQSLPWECDFTGTSTTIPSCWVKLRTSDQAYDASIYVNSLRFSGNNSSSYKTRKVVMVLPQFQTDIKNLKISFKHQDKGTSNSYPQFQVGYVTDPNDVSTFTLIQKITRYSSGMTSSGEVSLADAESGSYIAICYNNPDGGSTSGYAYLDDVLVESNIDCSKPATPVASDITGTSAHVAWTANAGVTSYKYIYQTSGSAAPDETAWESATTISANSVDLTGLTDGQAYDFYVMCACGTEASDPCTFISSSCPTVTDTWLSEQTYSSVKVSCVLSIANKKWDLQKSVDNGAWESVATEIADAYKAVAVEVGHSYAFQVKPSCGSDWTDAGSFEPAYPIPGTPSVTPAETSASVTWTAADGADGYEYVLMPGTTAASWTGAKNATSPLALNELTDGTNYTVYVRAKYGEGRSAEVSKNFTTATIAPAFTSAAATIEGTTATMALNEYTGTATKFQYVVMNGTAAANWTSATLIDKMESLVISSGLSVGNSYTVYVRAYYSATIQSAADSKSFEIACEAEALPFNYGFEDASLSGCWKTLRNNDNFSDPNISTTNPYKGSQCLRFFGGGSTSKVMVILPEFTKDIKNLQVSFYYKNASTYSSRPQFAVGYITDVTDITTYTQVQAFERNTSWTSTGDVELSGATAGARIAICCFGGNDSYNSYIDNITVSEIPECPAVTEVTLDNKSYNSATVNWTISPATNCDVRYSTDGGTSWTSAGTDISETSKAIAVSIGNTYTFAVKPHCNDAEEAWVTCAETYTPAYSAPANAAITSITDAAASASWDAVTDAPNGYKYAVVAAGETPNWDEATATVELTASLTGLAVLTDYDFYVGAVYGEHVEAAAPVNFQTVTIAPTDLVQGTTTVNSIAFSWSYAGAATKFQWKSSKEGSDWSEPISATNAEETGLTAGTSYIIYVRAYYADGKYSSELSETFGTECAVLSLPFSQDFEAGTSPICWSTTPDGYYDYAGNQGWKVTTDNDGNYVMRYKSGSALITPALTLPQINLTSTAALSFKVMNNYSNKTVNGQVTISAEGKDDLVTALTTSNSLTEQRIDLSDFAGKVITIQFQATGNTNGGRIDLDDIRILEQLTLADNVDNTETIDAYMNKTVDVTIERTLVAADYYNTICLPFDVPTLTGTPLEGGDLWAFKYAKVENEELLFRIIEADHIEAGVPYLIAFPNNPENIVNPLFKNVTIAATAGQAVGDASVAQFVGILKPETFIANDKTKLYLTANNTLNWWDGTGTNPDDNKLKSFRAYFNVNTNSGANYAPRHGMKARIIKSEQSATDVDNIYNNDVQSIKLLENNQVVIIRNGVKYNVQGQVIR